MSTKYFGTLFKIESSHDSLKHDVLDGWFYELPVEGKRFEMMYHNEVKGERYVTTSTVQESTKVLTSDLYADHWFTTKHSKYRLVVRDEVRA